MRNIFLSLLLLVGFTTVTAQQLKSPYFTFSPTLTPDGETIIFSYEGDLWKVSINGGQAYRMTAMEGEETRPSVSPDGKWLAFSGEQFGNMDVFIMPLEGGEIQQLTYHEATDEVESWSWDSQTIYFTSNRYNRYTAFEIDIAGFTPKRLFPNYFNTVHNTVVSPVTGEIFSMKVGKAKTLHIESDIRVSIIQILNPITLRPRLTSNTPIMKERILEQVSIRMETCISCLMRPMENITYILLKSPKNSVNRFPNFYHVAKSQCQW
ncbi:hypothetical protein V8V91_17515 [Algoriphagus halophilus]|uniref:hypothetical protein n=1 Tax=Algoriphagus halophilus TaxID=226505 RepID=UPI00358F96BE